MMTKLFFSVANNLGSPCASAPCFNGGTCKNEGEAFVCTCPRGFSGLKCEVEGRKCGSFKIFGK